ncbi:Uma2 family endonuclease [Streptomyces albipurpureus]|uniref:Uma2 family endonuclease n=1 Tax=Streptomyces albipurpureus TaxID=2897419 RepID=A0ABT0UQ89_9ACTN|nr:Uma2 family endonuclease [Streptomyces sp. CWNU-1]MCM2389411.1 Uma2 family endonuclease [Streptomyces sp. CWNU-1]
MTAEPIAGSTPSTGPVESGARWPVPPREGWTVDDLLTLPGLPPRTELIDGGLVFASPQSSFHSVAVDVLVSGLRRTAPPELRATRDMTVVIDKGNAPEPDVSVIRSEAVTGRQVTSYSVADVVLAVEVVSPDSEYRDRDTKPRKYAAAGIPHFWLVEMGGADHHPVVRVFERSEVTRTYALTGIHHDRLKLSVPFTVDIDLTEIDHL